MQRTWGMFTCALAFVASIPGDAPAQLRAPSLVGGAALLVLDLQVDFVDPAGRLPISRDQISPVLAAANRAIAAANGHLAVAYIGNEYGFWDIPGNWFRRGAAMKSSFGSALDPLVTRIAGAPYFAKHRGDAFSNDALERFLVSNDIGRVTFRRCLCRRLHLLHGAIRDKPRLPRDSACRCGGCRKR